ncbi:hypothetical protein CcCBS67573_g06562 [Chytriomyces confervae]|uniref:Uncharacterized protein n=1 Tax=Chytriomyces confervae TaxID=246404 RepID=A0A507F211_9FUNG|nr:hypothetical protein HDU80_008594 [Chytriomyces hyalinus]TPX70319.1 hypothetical protein CcCBS67573_g06562 [Chytriomyces confervae]
MASTYLPSYIINNLPFMASAASNTGPDKVRSQQTFSTAKLSSAQQKLMHVHQNNSFQNFPPPAQQAFSQDHQHIIYREKSMPSSDHQFNFQLPTPVLQTSQHIPADILSRFEAFEDNSSSKEMDEYASEIDQFTREMEIATLPDAAQIDAIQVEITWKHRKSLILWLIEVHGEYDLRPETLYLTINFIDRVSVKRIIRKGHFQLLGLTCLWSAAKYEENHGRVPSLKSLAMLLDNQFATADFITMEKLILSDLNYVLGHPTAESFLKSQCKQLASSNACNTDKPAVRALSRMVMELTLVHRRFRPFKPSLLAAASLILADSLYSCRVWRQSDPVFSRILSNLEECLVQAPRQIIEKYRSDKFLNISAYVRPMLENKSLLLYHSNQFHSPLHPTQDMSGNLTPPKDASPFRNPWPASTAQPQPQQLPSPNQGPEYPTYASYPHVAQRPTHNHFQQQKQVHKTQPAPLPTFQIPFHPQMAYFPPQTGATPMEVQSSYRPLMTSGVQHSYPAASINPFGYDAFAVPPPPDMEREAARTL